MIPLPQVEKELTEAIVKAVPEKERIARCYSTRKCACGVRIDEHLDWVPGLEDVLRALHPLIEKSNYKCVWMITTHGAFHCRKEDENGEESWDKGPDWYFNKPLSDQSEETKRFIHSLLAV